MILKQAILATLAYHDIFDYALTAEEIHKYLIGKKASLKSTSSVILERSLFRDRILNKSDLYSLKNRQNLFALRKQRAKYSQKKLKRALLYTKILSIIPTIKFIGVSGALAMQNSHKNDDIDLVIVTSHGWLWTTRLLSNLVLFPFKRRPNSKNTNNRACLNLFLDESDLEIKPQNLYTAHEICQLKPIYDKQRTYSKFIKSNKWIIKFFPNWQPQKVESQSGKSKFNYSLFTIHYSLIENFLKSFQLWYMRKKVSTERIGEHQLFFHPQNTQDWVLKEYQRRLRKLKLDSRSSQE